MTNDTIAFIVLDSHCIQKWFYLPSEQFYFSHKSVHLFIAIIVWLWQSALQLQKKKNVLKHPHDRRVKDQT